MLSSPWPVLLLPPGSQKPWAQADWVITFKVLRGQKLGRLRILMFKSRLRNTDSLLTWFIVNWLIVKWSVLSTLNYLIKLRLLILVTVKNAAFKHYNCPMIELFTDCTHAGCVYHWAMCPGSLAVTDIWKLIITWAATVECLVLVLFCLL